MECLISSGFSLRTLHIWFYCLLLFLVAVEKSAAGFVIPFNSFFSPLFSIFNIFPLSLLIFSLPSAYLGGDLFLSGLLGAHCELSASGFMSSVLEMLSVSSNIVSHRSFQLRFRKCCWMYVYPQSTSYVTYLLRERFSSFFRLWVSFSFLVFSLCLVLSFSHLLSF